MNARATRPVRVALVHLGCARNWIDSETILGRLGAAGYVLAGAVEDADVAVLNTCSFIGPARAESEQVLEDLLEAKGRGDLRSVLVVGCLPEKFREEVEGKYPAVDAFLGLSDYSDVARVVEDVLKGRRVRGGGGRRQSGQAEGPRFLQTPGSYAYVRPSHGCDHDCAFCRIPSIRGPQRSKPVETVVAEVQQLVAQGVREVVLVAEDSTGYGTDLGPGGPRLPELVAAVAEVPELQWLRLMYAYPNAFPWRLTEVMRSSPKVVPYLDIPIQHVSTPVLKRMRRGGTRESVQRILERLRAEVPGIALRTTVLVGHPGEGEAEFRELLDFLESFRFERLGAFAFSPEAETLAGQDPDRCSGEAAEERRSAVMEVQAGIHAASQRTLLGQVLPVMVDFSRGEVAFGRTFADAPDADALVKIAPANHLVPGSLTPVEITGVEGYDLLGRPAAEVEPRSSGRSGKAGRGPTRASL